MLTVHRAMRTYRDEVDVFIALTEFSRRKFIEGGLPAEKIVVKPNFVDPDPGVGERRRRVRAVRRAADGREGRPHVAPSLGNLGRRRAAEDPRRRPAPRRASSRPPRTASVNIEYLGRQPLDKVS